MNKSEIISRHAQALKGQVGMALAIDECEDIMESMMREAINYNQCCMGLLFTPDEIVKKINEQTVLDGETFRSYFNKK